MSIFSERLVNAREAMHWSRKRVVAETGIPYQTYSNYEQGKREPDISTITSLSTLFNTTNDYLMGKTDTFECKPTDEDGLFCTTQNGNKNIRPYISKSEIKHEHNIADLNSPVFALNGQKITGKAAEDIREYAEFVANRERNKKSRDDK